MEKFKNCAPERVVVYFNDQKAASLSEAAVFADEFALAHKTLFVSTRSEKLTGSLPTDSAGVSQPRNTNLSPTRSREERKYFYCHKFGHAIADCLTLKRKTSPSQQKPVGLVKTAKYSRGPDIKADSGYDPFIFNGLVSLTGEPKDQKPIRILRDTGASQSFLLADVLPWSDMSSCGTNVVVQGIEMGFVSVPLHWVHVQTDLVSGCFKARHPR